MLKNTRNKGAAGIWVAFVIIIAVIVYFVVAKDDGSGGNANSIEPTAEVKDALVALHSIETEGKYSSMSYRGGLSVDFVEPESQEAISLRVSLSGESQPGLEEGTESASIISLSIDSLDIPRSILPPNVNLSLDNGPVKFEMMGNDDLAYVRISGLPSIVKAMDTVGIEGTWIKISQEAIAELSGADISLITDKEANKEMQRQMIANISAALEAHSGILTAVKEYPQEKVNGVKTHHLEVVVDGEELLAFISAVLEGIPSEIYAAQGVGADPDLIRQEIMKALGGPEVTKFVSEIPFAEYPFEIWVGVEDNQMYKAALDLDLGQISGGKVEGNVSLALEILEYGVKVKFDEPKESVPVEELLAPFMGMIAPNTAGLGVQ